MGTIQFLQKIISAIHCEDPKHSGIGFPQSRIFLDQFFQSIKLWPAAVFRACLLLAVWRGRVYLGI